MTDRYSGFVVMLDHDLRSDDAEATIAAIRQIKGVMDVQPVESNVLSDQIAGQRARLELAEKVRAALRE